MDNWIKCSERMPPEGRDIMVWRRGEEGGFPFIVRFFDGADDLPYFVQLNAMRLARDSVSHWAELPESPKE